MERVNIADLTAERLFKENVSKRRPLVISGVPSDPSFQAFRKWPSIAYLKSTAGAAKVKVEPMHSAKKQYGTSTPRVTKTFAQFLSSLEQSSSESYDYLTTQYDDDSADEDDVSKETFPEPIRSLLKDVPLKPEIMGNLALQQMNLWLGRSEEGASSGLHHDFHDNLYILLKGRKRFVLFPPQGVEYFKPFGRVEKVHENGLIVYKAPSGHGGNEGEEDDEEEAQAKQDGIRGDGLSEKDAAGLRVQAIERKIEELQGVEGKEEELEGLEEILDEAVENMMDFMMDEAKDAEEEDDEDDFDEEEGEDDEALDGVMEKIGAHLEATAAESNKKRKAEDDLDGHDAKAAKSDDEEEEEEIEGDGFEDASDEEDEEDGLQAFPEGSDNASDSEEEEEQLKAALKAAQQQSSSANDPEPTPQEPSEPLSFSQISTQELHQHLGLKQPQNPSEAFSKAPKPLIVELKAGDMLYLPTSWWHEVTSFSEEKGEGKDDGEGEGESIHMALNYWFHPPDQLNNFESPYQDELVWEFLSQRVKEAYEGLVRA